MRRLRALETRTDFENWGGSQHRPAGLTLALRQSSRLYAKTGLSTPFADREQQRKFLAVDDHETSEQIVRFWLRSKMPNVR